MSYDVSIEYMGGSRDFNYTSNLGAFFAWALETENTEPWGLRWLDDKSVEVVVPCLRAALERIRLAPEEDLAKFDSPNSWGNHASAAQFLLNIYAACLEHPDGRVRVSA